MSFFDPPPPPPPMPDFPPQPVYGRFIPGIVPVERALARNDRAAIVLRSFEVYPDGIDIRLDSYVRDRDAGFGGFGHLGGTMARLAMARAVAPPEDETDEDPSTSAAASAAVIPAPRFPFRGFMEDEFNFGVQFPDGTKLTTLRPYAPTFDFTQPPSEPPRAGMDVGGGGGSNEHYEWNYFVWPIPGPGTLTLVCEWSTHGIAESVTTFDTAPLLAAAQRVQTLWDEDAGLPSHHSFVDSMIAMRRHMDDQNG